jgi:hypothetical protein
MDSQTIASPTSMLSNAGGCEKGAAGHEGEAPSNGTADRLSVPKLSKQSGGRMMVDASQVITGIQLASRV